jgi:hypothetical protein
VVTAVLGFRNACAAAAVQETTLRRDDWYEQLDRIGRAFDVPARMMVMHAVGLLPRITVEEMEAHPGLAVAHWLVLAELIPEAGPYRTTWIIRCEQMRFTAKMLRTDLLAGLEALAREKAKTA